jgi:hypothetical protein
MEGGDILIAAEKESIWFERKLGRYLVELLVDKVLILNSFLGNLS